MTINMEQAARRQTIDHFIHAFMKDCDTEKAADRTMKSKYVPQNIKTQLVLAMSQCEADDRPRIERVAHFGMFIDSCCNELVFFNKLSTAVMRWTISLYIDSGEIKRIFHVIMEDVGRICDEDIQFIMEKYRYLEDSGMLKERVCSDNSLLGLLKPKKYSPDTSMMRYYGKSLWEKILRAALRNSVTIFNADTFSSVFSGYGDGDTVREDGDSNSDGNTADGLDRESVLLYDEFRKGRTQWLKAMAAASQDRLEKAATTEDHCGDSNGSSDDDENGRRFQPRRQPPKVSTTAFDVQFDENADASDNSDDSDTETVLKAPCWYRKKDNQAEVHADNVENSVVQLYNGELDIFQQHDDDKALNNNHTAVRPSEGTTCVATVTQEKTLHIVNNELKDILLEEKMSREMSTKTNDWNNGGGSITTVKTTLTKRRHHKRYPHNRYRQFKPMTLGLQSCSLRRRHAKNPSNRYKFPLTDDDSAVKQDESTEPLIEEPEENVNLFTSGFEQVETTPACLSLTFDG